MYSTYEKNTFLRFFPGVHLVTTRVCNPIFIQTLEVVCNNARPLSTSTVSSISDLGKGTLVISDALSPELVV